MPRQTTLTVRLSEEEAELLDLVMGQRGVANRSEAIRQLITEASGTDQHEASYMETTAMPALKSQETVSLKLPSKFSADIDFLVGIDYHRSRDEVLYTAVKTYLYENLDLWKIKKRAEDMKEIELIVAEDGALHLR